MKRRLAPVLPLLLLALLVWKHRDGGETKDTGATASIRTASGTNPQLRVIEQPTHGTVGIAGTVATYFPDSGYQGPDVFTYIASDSGSFVDSQPATVSVIVGTTDYTRDSDGDGMSDWIEYALGLDPLLRSVAPQHQIENVGGTNYLTLRVLRSPMRPPEMTTTIKVSGDLQGWSPATILNNTSTELKARDTIGTDAALARFIRIESNRP